MANNVLISDVSLREYGKAENFSLSFKEKLDVAKKLSELKADVIELGPVSSDKADEILIKTVCNVIKETVVCCAVGNTIESVERTYSLVSGAKKKRLLVNVPVSPVQMEYFVSKKPKAVLELLGALTAKSKELCKEVEVVLNDATRAEPKFLYEAVKTAIDNGATWITIADIAGTMLPEEFGNFIEDIIANVPEIKNVKICVEYSDSLSFAGACYVSAMMKGVHAFKISSLGGFNLISTQAFTSVMESVAVKKGFTYNLNKTAFNRILKQMASVFTDKTNISGIAKNDYDDVEKNLSIEELSKIIAELGYELIDEDIQKVYAEYLRVSEKKEVKTLELEEIIASVALQVPETYSVDKFSVQSSNVISATASVVLKKDGKELSGISFGNGAVDAAFMAIENILGRHFELDDFQISSITEGKGAMGKTIVKLRSNGKIYSGKGLSTDIIGSSIRAYVNALNKIVYEENE